jgi:hypothetical protein
MLTKPSPCRSFLRLVCRGFTTGEARWRSLPMFIPLATVVMLMSVMLPAQSFSAGQLSGRLYWNGAVVQGSGTGTIYVYIPGLTGEYLPSTGVYSFSTIAAGAYAVDVYGNGCAINSYLLGSTMATVSSGATTTANIDLTQTAGRVTGTVYLNGAPLPSPNISISGLCGQWQTETTGAFSHYLPPGSYTANVTNSSGTLLGSFSFQINAGQVTDAGIIDLSGSTTTVSGRVLWNGTTVSGTFVTTIFAYIPSVGGTYIDSQGNFTLNGPINPATEVDVYGNGCVTSNYRIGSLPLSAQTGGTISADVDITSTAGRVTGTVTVNGTPLSNPSISIPGFCGSWRTDSNGQFLHYLPPGSYSANVAGPSGYLGTFTFTIIAGQTTDIGTLNYSVGNVVASLVWNNTVIGGLGTRTLFTALSDSSGNYLTGQYLDPTTNAFSFAGLAAGSYQLAAFQNGCSLPADQISNQVPVSVAQGSTSPATIDITSTAGRVTGQVSVNGVPLANPSISIQGLCGTWSTSTDGTFLQYLKPGDYTAQVSGQSGPLGSFQFTIVAGQTTRVDFTQAGSSPSSITLSSSFNPSVIGQSVTLSATVSGAQTTPSGTISFNDGPNILGSSTLDSTGLAVFPISSLQAGSHTLTAKYSGDSVYASGGSAPLVQIVNTSSPGASLSSPSLAFGDQLVGTRTAPKSITLSNSGTSSLNINAIAIAGANASEFSQTNNCETSVEAGNNCTIEITFAPSLTGVGTASLTVTDDATGSPQSVVLTGNGTVSVGTGQACVAPPSGLVSWWSADGNFDDIQGSNSGTSAGGVSFVPGEVDEAFHFQTTSGSYITLPNSPDLLPSSNQLTIEAWIKPDWSVHNSVDLILDKIDQCGGTRSYTLGLDKYFSSGPYQPGVMVFSASVGGDDAISATAFPQDGKFHHMAGTYDGSMMNLYFDGVLVGQKVHTGAIPFTSNPPYIGLQGACGDLSAADMDEVSFYNRALTQSEIQAIVNAGSAGKCKIVATTTTLASSPNPSTIGQSVMFTAAVAPNSGTGTPSGTVTFKDGATTLGTGVLNASGQATYTSTSLAVGTHPITASYGGNSQFDISTSPALSQIVNKFSTSTALGSSGNPSTFGQSVTFTATVSSNGGTPTGTVRFYDGATTLGTGTLNGSGQAKLSTANLNGGVHTITAAYSGDNTLATSTSSALAQNVNRAATSTTLNSSPNPSIYGQAVTLTATVSSGPGVPTGTVTFYDGTTTLGTGTLNSGHATLSTAGLSASTHSMSASYGGDTNFATSTSGAVAQTVAKAATTTTLSSSPNPSTMGQTVNLIATVAGQYGGVATGTVTFKDGSNTVLGTVSLVSGSASLPISSLGAGSHTITAVYAGDSNFNGSTSNSISQTVASKPTTTTTVTSSLNPSFVGQSVTFTATVSPSAATGTVTFKAGQTVLGTGSLSSGQATFSTSSLSAGSFNIVAVYSGDTQFASSTSGPVTQIVNKAATTTTLSSVPNPSSVGQSVTFTATVTSSTGVTPTGTVSFNQGATTLGTATLNSAGTAIFSTSTLSKGKDNIKAVYGASSAFSGSTSAAITQVVQ